MASKVNWKDKKTIEGAVTKSSSYADTLTVLGLKKVSANTKTLKKYIEHHEISTEHFGGVVTKKKGEMAWWSMKGLGEAGKDGFGLESDWNDQFISDLKQQGYTGTENEMAGKFFVDFSATLGARLMGDRLSEFE